MIACEMLLDERLIAECLLDVLPVGCETGAMLVDVLDELDAASDELEDEENDREEDGDVDYSGSSGVTIIEYCPCCGCETGEEYITT